MTEPSLADMGVIGLGVMGRNLSRNIESRGFTVTGFDLDPKKGESLSNETRGKRILVADSLESLSKSCKKPRKIMMMVPAGKAVDEIIEKLLPVLEPGDILIDGGNSHFPDTIRRTKYVESKGLLYVGTGVSGGEEGALHGPSMMPGGSPGAWPYVKPVFQAICAKTPAGEPCCDWVGENGAGHFVKMVHNGIEYGDMQLICESYQLMKEGLRMSNAEMHDAFSEWNKGELESYLIEITRDIFGFKDEKGKYVVDLVLDTAGQKGTGKWTSVSALDLGIPVTMVAEAVFARCLSALKDERVAASKILKGPKSIIKAGKKSFVEDIRKAMYASKITSYAQGYMLMREAAKEYKWNLNYGGIALIWRGGCIIRSAFLGKIKEAFDRNPNLSNLLVDPFFKKAVTNCQASWRNVISKAVLAGEPVPAMTSALCFFDGYRNKRLPANLLQAQRDYFGAHTYERIDKPRGEFFHTHWTGQ